MSNKSIIFVYHFNTYTMFKEIKEIKAGDTIITNFKDEDLGYEAEMKTKENTVAEVGFNFIKTTEGNTIYSRYSTNGEFFFKVK